MAGPNPDKTSSGNFNYCYVISHFSNTHSPLWASCAQSWLYIQNIFCRLKDNFFHW